MNPSQAAMLTCGMPVSQLGLLSAGTTASAEQEAARPAWDGTGGMPANKGIPSSAWSTDVEWSVHTTPFKMASLHWAIHLPMPPTNLKH